MFRLSTVTHARCFEETRDQWSVRHVLKDWWLSITSCYLLIAPYPIANCSTYRKMWEITYKLKVCFPKIICMCELTLEPFNNLSTARPFWQFDWLITCDQALLSYVGARYNWLYFSFRPPAGKVYQRNENRAWSQVRLIIINTSEQPSSSDLLRLSSS